MFMSTKTPWLIVAALHGITTTPSLAQDLSNQDRSMDIELVRPTFSRDSFLGVDHAVITKEGEFQAGLLLQYEKAPLRMIERDVVTGAIVNHRQVMHLGLSYAPSKRFAARLNIPIAGHWGNQVAEWTGDGFGVGDLFAGARFHFGTWKGFSVGMHGDVGLPFSKKDAYMGERLPRTVFGLLVSYDNGPLTVTTDIGPALRAPVDNSAQDFKLGNELIWNTGISILLPEEQWSIDGSILIRGGFERFFVGYAENSMEWVAGVRYRPTQGIQLNGGIGRGITQGYGTTGVRVMAGITFRYQPKDIIDDEPELDVLISDMPDDEDLIEVSDPVVVDDGPRPWQEGELAQLQQERIVIREPIQFEFNTANILPESLPTLAAVAGLLNSNDAIGHLLIEGHASEEGTFNYNYELSIRRAKAIFEQLIVNGTHPSRMSYRGMGEVVPNTAGSDEASLATNRRVEFKIIRQYTPDERPSLETNIKLPWDGTEATVERPEAKGRTKGKRVRTPKKESGE